MSGLQTIPFSIMHPDCHLENNDAACLTQQHQMKIMAPGGLIVMLPSSSFLWKIDLVRK